MCNCKHGINEYGSVMYPFHCWQGGKYKLKVQRCRENIELPVKTKGNAGIDLRLYTEDRKEVTLQPKQIYKFYTGLKMDIAEGFYIEVSPRSSTGVKKHLKLVNTVAILDSSWKGETLIFMENFGDTPVTIQDGERLCQMIIHQDIPAIVEEVSDVGTSERGENGFGSTGDM